MRKQIMSIALCLFMLLSLLPTSAPAAHVVASGDFGAHGSGTWSVDSDGVLTISGEVGMPGGNSVAPWYNYGGNIKSVSFAPNTYAKVGAKLDYMFFGLTWLTSIDLTGFNTSEATSMSNMFNASRRLATIILPSSFDTSKVTNMSAMFKNCSELTALDLSSFSTSAVTDMSEMFYGCTKLATLTLSSSFDTSAVTNMSAMFKNCSGLTALDLSSFSTSAVTNIEDMFYNCKALTSLDLSSFDTSKLTDMSSMFYDCAKLATLTLSSSFDTSAVTDMKEMFYNCKALTSIDLSSFNTSNVKNMGKMFKYCNALTSLDLSSFSTSAVTDMSDMFYDCKALTTLNLSSFDTSNVTTMNSMFRGNNALTALTLPSSFTTANVTTMGNMFNGCKTLTSLDLSGFDTSKVTDMSGMFYGCTNLDTLTLSSSFDTSAVTDMKEMFYNCAALTSIDLSSFNTSAVTDMQSMFQGCAGLSSLDLSSFNTSAVTDMQSMFQGCAGLSSLDLSSFNTSAVTDMQRMFSGCKSLTTLTLSSTFTTSNVENMKYMFDNCEALATLDVSNFDTSAVTDMQSMFNKCKALTSLTLPSTFTTPKVTSMNRMFTACGELTSLNLSSFDTSEVTNMSDMFYDCNKLTSLDLSSFNTSKVTNMNSMFENCNKLTSLDLSSFNTSKVTDMGFTFYNCRNLKSLTLSGLFDTSAVEEMGSLFANCNALTNLNLSSFNTASVTNMNNMFSSCCSLAESGTVIQGFARNAEEAEKFNNSSVTRISTDKLVFIVPTYTVTLHANNGSAETVQVENLGGSYTLPECSFDDIGLRQFSGWALSENGTVIEGSDIILMDNTDLYAIWEIVPHTHEFVHHEAKAPTCTEIGWYEYDVCSLCDYSTRVEIPATEHNYAFSSFLWDGFTAKAVYVCGNDSAHTQEFDATVTSVMSTEQICETGGEITYTATYIGEDGTHTDTKIEEITAAGHSCNTEWESDGTNHWHVCNICGAKVDETAHSGGEATCTAKAACEVCEVEYGELKAHSFTVTRYDEAQHWHECANCDATTEKENHFGGEATCAARAICEGCEAEYGETLEHSFTDLQHNASQHWMKCADCSATTEKANHVGGEATCTQLAICEDCQAEYGDFADHIPDESVWLSDEHGHWHECSNPDCEEKTDFAEHNPDYDEATDEHGITCTVCGYEIAGAYVHSHSATVFVGGAPATCTDTGTKDCYECSCGKRFFDEGCTQLVTDDSQLVIEKLPHVDADEDGKCDACSEDISPKLTFWDKLLNFLRSIIDFFAYIFSFAWIR